MKNEEDAGGSEISAEKLCALSGLTDRRHRQLAKDGWFPPPVRGQYQLIPTLQGMFKYYRTSMDGGTHGTRFREARDMREEARARSAMVKAKMDESQVVPVEEALRLITRSAGQVRTRLLAIPAKAAALLEGKGVTERAAVIRQEVDDALAELQRMRLERKR